MKSVTVKTVDLATFSDLLENRVVPIWVRPKNCTFYENSLYLVALRGGVINGAWTIPIMTAANGKKMAKRSYRLLPYAAPILFGATSLARRFTMELLFLELTRHVEFIALPLSPNLFDISILQNHGVLVEWRHTHTLDASWAVRPLPPKISNQLRHAKLNLQLERSQMPDGFFFERAVTNEGDLGIQRRAEFARSLLETGEGYYWSAFHKNELVGQSFVAMDGKTHYLLHTWSLKNKVRGVSTALVDAAARECFLGGMDCSLDLEGSVLPGVDEFFYGFHGKITPYGFLLWSRNGSLISADLAAEIMPPERMISVPSEIIGIGRSI